MKTSHLLDLTTLALPPYPHVLSAEVEDYTDADGEAALRVNVILAEDTDLDRVTGEDSLNLRSAIRRNLVAKNSTLFPYIFLEIKGERERDMEDEV